MDEDPDSDSVESYLKRLENEPFPEHVKICVVTIIFESNSSKDLFIVEIEKILPTSILIDVLRNELFTKFILENNKD